MESSRFRWGVGAVLLLLFLGGCLGPAGDDGRLLARFRADASVGQVTLTGIGVSVAAAPPDPAIEYNLAGINGGVSWVVGALPYQANLSVDVEDGKEGGMGLLPHGNQCACPPLTATQGKDGKDQAVVILFADNKVFVLTGSTTY